MPVDGAFAGAIAILESLDMASSISGARDTALPESEQELNRLNDKTMNMAIKAFISINSATFSKWNFTYLVMG